MASVTLDNVSKVFDEDIVAVDNISLNINDGEFVVIVGPSGSGKSTTLRMVAGLETPSDGDIYIGSDNVTGGSARTRDIAMVFQNYALYPHMTVQENIGFGLKLSTTLDQSEIDDRVNEVADLLGIEPLLDKEPKELSGGQQQRVALGRAIVRYPEAFLFDEPLSNLDAKLRNEMRTEIKRLQQELEVTSIYVTHNQAEAMTMADRVVVMHEGQIQQVGTPEEIYEDPANRFVAEFIGEPSMNCVAVDVEVGPDSVVLKNTRSETDFEYRLPPEMADHIGLAEGDSVTAGVRPEDIVFVNPEDDRKNTMGIEVNVFEPMGSDNYHYFSVAGQEWTGRTGSSKEYSAGENVQITFDLDDLYLFDEHGKTLKSKGVGVEASHAPEA
ncbi:ABC transporter ATP-binding protein [Halobellus rarus]|uniref:ABC-type D-xylose/L-arabinose transporter n=1 Tax=Halobellus rarus TaxID=1126237 RepID=A0ABD6CTT8_9EURY|nr:ABC transporter ATP-binding protein [Halobellus rarus]